MAIPSEKMLIGIILISVNALILVTFQITQIFDVKNRKDTPTKKKWLVFNLLPIVGVLFAFYYYSKVKSTLEKKVTSNRPKTPQQPKKQTSGGLISKPISKEKIIQKRQAKPKPPQKPKKVKSEPTIKKEVRIPKPEDFISPDKKNKPVFRVENLQTTLVGYGEQRKLDKIEENASQAPVRGRTRVHEVDKVEMGKNGLLLTYGLHRFELIWEDIFMMVGGQAPITSKDSLMLDIFSRKNYAPYRIFDQKIMYQQFIPKVEYNVDKNFKAFLRFLVEKLPGIPIDPDTRDYIANDNKLYSNTYRNFHEFDLYVWKIRSQVMEDYNIKLEVPNIIDESPQEQEPNKIVIKVTEQIKNKPPKKATPQNDKFVLILRDFERDNREELIKFIMKLLKCPREKAEKLTSKMPSVIAKNVTQDIGLKLSRKFSDLGAYVQGIPMEEYEKTKKKK